jgi:hypothetical protein
MRRAGLVPLFARLLALSSTISIVALVAFNLVPLVGVLFWGWSLRLILVLYWLESGIVGIINIFKIALARGPEPVATSLRISGTAMGRRIGPAIGPNQAAGCLIPFFIVHYGIFWFVHGVFVFTLPLFASIGRFGDGATPDLGALPGSALLFGAIGLAISHVASFFLNYVGRREYLRVSPGQQMFSVYGRVVALHLTILGGGFLIVFLGTPVAALAILVVAKIVLDLRLHLRERERGGVG